jgi:hypothetical protein
MREGDVRVEGAVQGICYVTMYYLLYELKKPDVYNDSVPSYIGHCERI